MAVPVSTNAGGLTAGKPEALFQTRIKGGGTANNDPEYDVASDGRFLVNVAKTDPPPITVIQNWAPKPASDR
jgi:hypothetical protein